MIAALMFLLCGHDMAFDLLRLEDAELRAEALHVRPG